MSNEKPDVGSVIEAVEARGEALCGHKVRADAEGVLPVLLFQTGFTLCKGREKKGIAIRGKHKLVGLEIEGDDTDMTLGNGEAIENAVGNVLLLHRPQHVGDDGSPCCISNLIEFLWWLPTNSQPLAVFRA